VMVVVTASKSSATGAPIGRRLSNTWVLFIVAIFLGTHYVVGNLTCKLTSRYLKLQRTTAAA
jgi:hypothetical protein